MIDFDDNAPAASEAPSGGNDLMGLFSYAAQPVQTNVTAQYQQQQQPPSTYAPTPLLYNNSSGMSGMNTLIQPNPNTISPYNQLSGTPPPASIALPRSNPTSQRSTPVLPAGTTTTPNYFGNVGARGPVGGSMGVGMSRGIGAGVLPMSMPMGSVNAGSASSGMNLSGAMSGMNLNGGGHMGMGMSTSTGPGSVMLEYTPPQSTIPYQQPRQPPTLTPAPAPPQMTTATTAPAGQKGNDPFADLAGLF